MPIRILSEDELQKCKTKAAENVIGWDENGKCVTGLDIIQSLDAYRAAYEVQREALLWTQTQATGVLVCQGNYEDTLFRVKAVCDRSLALTPEMALKMKEKQ